MQGEAHIVVPGSAVLYCSADVLLDKPRGSFIVHAQLLHCIRKFACLRAGLHA